MSERRRRIADRPKVGDPTPMDPERQRLGTRFIDIVSEKTGANTLTDNEKRAKSRTRFADSPNFATQLKIPAGIDDLNLGYVYSEGSGPYSKTGGFFITVDEKGKTRDTKLHVATMQRPDSRVEFIITSHNPNAEEFGPVGYFPELRGSFVTPERLEEIMDVMEDPDSTKVQQLLDRYHGVRSKPSGNV